jgi:hypothetical protein
MDTPVDIWGANETITPKTSCLLHLCGCTILLWLRSEHVPHDVVIHLASKLVSNINFRSNVIFSISIPYLLLNENVQFR